ncbi:hypothetical protein DEU56DRAFT_773646 [Suillus clintonianus]|uniref:uncharacterized protein n=1 Tax=Suillus clintonianus TaxID=1904413 RepID=UPI001B87BD49|nr:uncharacterized protein DEU56DRAFT_773646 [Suillus clintonianus]KAG2153202.1 hypothetical protein DEU56DRAFT_773646 [Suillus clintonianus]
MEDVLQWLRGHLVKSPKLPRLLQGYTIVRLTSFTLFLTAFLLFLLVGLSLPIIKSIIIIKVSAINSVDPVLNAITELQFGVWGVCASSILDGIGAQEACYGPQLGYTIPTSLLSLVGLSSEFANIAETTLLTMLVLHLVTAALSTVSFVLSFFLPSRLITIIALVIAIITSVISTVVFAADVALVVGVKDNIDSLFPGADFAVSFGNGVWMTLAAMVLTWIAVIMLSAQLYHCCGAIRPKPKASRSGVSEKDSMEKVLV